MHRLARSAVLAAFLVACAPAGAAATTPERIREATARGEISSAAGLLYRAYALHAPTRVPTRFRAREPYDGTLELVQLRADLARLPTTSPTRREIEALTAVSAGTQHCIGEQGAKTGAADDAAVSPFHIQYDAIGGGLNLSDYRGALVTAYDTEVTAFGWVPPPAPAVAPPGGRYHVVIADLGPELYGYTSTEGTFAGPVAPRSVTSSGQTWTVADGEASCMVLNANFDQLLPAGGTPAERQGKVLAALRATAAHEFNHALQFSLGVIEADDLNNMLLTEASATLMEDEVQDAANDNLHYLSRAGGTEGRPEPNFSDSLIPRPAGETEFYATWFLLRGLTERFGTTTAGGGEDVAQLMWELTSGRPYPPLYPSGGSYLGALDGALLARSANTVNLGIAYHDAGIADWFLKDCDATWVLPYCFEEAAAYRARFTPGIPARATLASVPSSTPATTYVERNYAIEFVRLPDAGTVPPVPATYDVTITNAAPAGASLSGLRATVVCDKPGAGGLYRLPAAPMTLTPTAGDAAETVTVDTTGCTAGTVAAIVSSANHATQSPQCDSRVYFNVAVAPVGTPSTAPTPPAPPAPFCNPVSPAATPTPTPTPSPTGTATPTAQPTAAPTADPPPPATIELPPAPSDLTPPDVNVSLARRTLRGLLTFTVTCPPQEETRCDVSLRGTATRSRRKVPVARLLALAMAPGERRKLRVRLRAADIRKLGRGLVTVTLVTNANDGAGNRITGSRFSLKTRI